MGHGDDKLVITRPIHADSTFQEMTRRNYSVAQVKKHCITRFRSLKNRNSVTSGYEVHILTEVRGLEEIEMDFAGSGRTEFPKNT